MRIRMTVSQFTWNIGEILHMSMMPEPRYWPVEMKKVRSGIPKARDSRRNWTTKTAGREGLMLCG